MGVLLHRILALAAAATLLGGACAPAPALAQSTYPDHPIRIVVPFAAGGGVDILTRKLAQEMTTSLGQGVIVDDRAGAGGNVGVDVVAKSPPDGYTLVMATTGTHTINPGLYHDLPFNSEKDFKPITLIASVPNLLVVNPTLPVHSVKELVALAKSEPGKLTFASFGNGTSNHLSGELLKMLAGIDVVHVPYKSATQAVTDLIAGRTSFAFVNTPLALPHVKDGKLRALAVTGGKRSASVPDYPTMSEAGVKDFVVESWYGLMAPAKTPDAIIKTLRDTVLKVLAKPAMKTFFQSQGADIETTTPAEFSAMIKSETARWADVIKKSGAHID